MPSMAPNPMHWYAKCHPFPQTLWIDTGSALVISRISSIKLLRIAYSNNSIAEIIEITRASCLFVPAWVATKTLVTACSCTGSPSFALAETLQVLVAMLALICRVPGKLSEIRSFVGFVQRILLWTSLENSNCPYLFCHRKINRTNLLKLRISGTPFVLMEVKI